MIEKQGMRYFISTAAMVMAVFFAGKTLAAECDGWQTPSFWEETDMATVEACIAAGSKANARDVLGGTPLHWAAWFNDNPDIIDALIRHGADVNARTERGRTPLHVAVELNKNPDIIDALIRHGAKVNAKDEDGYTPSQQCC